MGKKPQKAGENFRTEDYRSNPGNSNVAHGFIRCGEVDIRIGCLGINPSGLCRHAVDTWFKMNIRIRKQQKRNKEKTKIRKATSITRSNAEQKEKRDSAENE